MRQRRAENLLRKILYCGDGEVPVGVVAQMLIVREVRAFLAWTERTHLPDYPAGPECSACHHEAHPDGPCGAPTGKRPDYGTCVCEVQS